MSGHTLTVAYHEGRDDYDLTIGHGDGPCPHTWEECSPCPEPPPSDDPDWDDLYEWYDGHPRHGVEHRIFDDMACIETDRCYISDLASEGIADALDDDYPREPGTYPLDYDSDGDYGWLVVRTGVTP